MKFNSILIAAVVTALPIVANASPLVNISILGSTDGGNTWSSSISAPSGTTVKIEVVEVLAQPVTSNTHATTTSLNPATDGVNSLAYGLTDSTDGTFGGDFALLNGWNGGSGASAGTVGPHTLSAARPIQAPGVFVGAVSPSVIETGSFTVGDTGPETVTGAYNNSVGSTFKINGGSLKPISGTTEASADPYVGFAPLAINAAPEPTSMAVLGFGVAGLLARRRRA